MKTILLLLLPLLLLPIMTHAQPTPPPAGPRQDEPAPGRAGPFWRCELPGGTYSVLLRTITSISTHEYVVDGAARVTEMNIDTNGSTLARFYYLEPITPTSPLGIGQSALDMAREKLEQATQRTGTEEVWRKVVKSYPATTHSRTVEYRLDSKETLEKLFRSADTAWRTGRNTVFKEGE